MVKRWRCTVAGAEDDLYAEMYPEPAGEYVLYSEYLDLREALKEALEGWESWYHNYPDKEEQAKIAQLRSLYLGGGPADPRDEDWYKKETGKFG